MTYRYSGVDFSVIDEPVRQPIPRSQFSPYSCGTYAGYRQHQRYGTEACPECKQAKARKSAAYYAKTKSTKPAPTREFNASDCGTRKGYYRHLRAGGPTCDACREAQADYMINYRKIQRMSNEKPARNP